MADPIYEQLMQKFAGRGRYPGMDIPEFYEMARELYTPEEAAVAVAIAAAMSPATAATSQPTVVTASSTSTTAPVAVSPVMLPNVVETPPEEPETPAQEATPPVLIESPLAPEDVQQDTGVASPSQ